jgi:hypothetical protein
MSKTVVLYSEPFLDTYNQCYKNIVTLNLMPQGPLANYVIRVKKTPLSTFKQSTPCNPINKCALAIQKIMNSDVNGGCCVNVKNSCNLMTVDDVPDLFSFLFENGYMADTSLTKMMNASDVRFQTNNQNKLICFLKYVGV